MLPPVYYEPSLDILLTLAAVLFLLWRLPKLADRKETDALLVSAGILAIVVSGLATFRAAAAFMLMAGKTYRDLILSLVARKRQRRANPLALCFSFGRDGARMLE